MDEERLLGKFVQHMGRREMETNLHNNESESGGQSRGQHAYKWVCLLCDPSVQIESYSQQMTEKYAREEEQSQLDPEVWVAASSAPKKGHVYGFGHSMDTSRVLSGASSSASQTSAFTTAGAPGTSPYEMMGFIQDEISGLESRLAQTMESPLAQTMESHLVHTIQTQVSDAI
ncbi:hypothetical protein Taro_031743 [Colocasia esculenta]|uniref:Uncharacterized protein n=1 Tax=Colocasia esculenta TaxID=4460 RepID=A0A843VSU6_COLES|nr:hypothetical protein [Colocasia esculenta]